MAEMNRNDLIAGGEDQDEMQASTATTTMSNDEEEKLGSLLSLPYYNKEVNVLYESIQKAMDLIQHYSEQQEQEQEQEQQNNTDQVYQSLDEARTNITNAWQQLHNAFHSKDDDYDDEKASKKDASSSMLLTEQDQIRIAYLNMVTDAFGDVLEQFHAKASANNNDDSDSTFRTKNVYDLDVLADCLQSGYDMLSLLHTGSGPDAVQQWYDDDFVWDDCVDNDVDGDDVVDDIDHGDDKDRKHVGGSNSGSIHHHNEDTMHLTPHERHRRALGYNVII